MSEEEKRCRPWLVALIQKAALPTKASTQNQLYQSTSWLGQGAVMMYVMDLEKSTLHAPVCNVASGVSIPC